MPVGGGDSGLSHSRGDLGRGPPPSESEARGARMGFSEARGRQRIPSGCALCKREEEAENTSQKRKAGAPRFMEGLVSLASGFKPCDLGHIHNRCELQFHL